MAINCIVNQRVNSREPQASRKFYAVAKSTSEETSDLKMSKVNTSLFIIAFICLLSCKPIPKNGFEAAMQKAGKNRPELEKVIVFYSKNPADSLKLKAAYFLIENMADKFWYEGKLLDHYYEYFKRPDRSILTAKKILDSIANIYGSFSYDSLNKMYDIQELKSSFLINNINAAFMAWEKQPWGKDISFSQFCNYILPYRVGDEDPQYDRTKIFIQFNGLLDSVRHSKGSAVEAFTAISSELKGKWNFTYDLGFLPHFPSRILLSERIGTCRDESDLFLFIMRALGIPVTNDLTPQWANRSLGHNWPVVIDRDGKPHEFDPNPYNPYKFRQKKAKIYRDMFSKQQQSLAVMRGKKDVVPTFFDNAYIKDVSQDYGGIDINITLDKKPTSKRKYAYLCVFNNRDWIPVHWGKLKKNGQVNFSAMGTDIVYLPSFYNGQLTPASFPFILFSNGCIRKLHPNTTKKQSIRILRKYSLLNVYFRLDRMAGGKFQGANQSDFKDKVDLYVIKTTPDTSYNTIHININKSFRFLRYYTPREGQCNIAELEFYANDSLMPLKGIIIGSKGSYNNMQERTKEKAMDGNLNTFFDLPSDSAWVGIDIGYNTKQKVTKVRFAPANYDGNDITKGDDYELFYWDEAGWISVGRVVADSNELIFSNVPSNALYWIHNHSGGMEERIFTYENGKQVWW